MKFSHALVFSIAFVFPFSLFGQAVRPLPYSAQLSTDPAVGNIQGIQRYGRPLRTDPDQGEGFSYHVYPVAHSSAVVGQGDPALQSGVLSHPAPFDWTSGIRNFGPPSAPGTAVDPQTGTQSAVITRSGLKTTISQIYHQPLIQIKMRVVEVDRTDGVALGSILEYVSEANAPNTTLTSGQTANTNADGTQAFENFRSIARFVDSNLLQTAASGTGALVNLTSEHINWLVQGLATELNADVITAPEVVTLNGQNVEFVAGDKLPFQLGQNVIQGTNNNIQQVFYKHVGTMVSVTPRIVNWGLHGEGRGEASVQAKEVLDWKRLIAAMLDKKITHQPGTPATDNQPAKPSVDISDTLTKYKDQQFIPYSAQTEILKAVNNYSRDNVRFVLDLAEQEIISEDCSVRCRTWKPGDCTIDLAVVVRLSEGAPAGAVPDPTDPMKATLSTNTEANIRAVANVIQVQSGHGVVMAGLIGENETENLAKVPLLGDLPVVGAAFRSKTVTREKTELLIFIEAQVMDPDPLTARAESANDFLLGSAYVEGNVLDNPLEIGMCRIGFGTYLPPHTAKERLYWEKFDRKVRKVRSHVSDALEP